MSTPRRAFTIIELMVSVAVIAVLLGILLPALRSVKVAGLELAVVNHQRQVAAELERYMVDHKNFFPHYAEAGAAEAFLEYPPKRERSPDSGYAANDPETGAYWGQPHFWWWLLETKGYDGSMARSGPEVEPGWDEMMRPFSAFPFDTLTYCAFARDELFQSEPQFDRLSLRTPRKGSDVAHPSAKGVLSRFNRLREGRGILEAPLFVAFADGHAEMVAADRLIPGAGIFQLTGNPGLAVETTVGGLGGRDLLR